MHVTIVLLHKNNDHSLSRALKSVIELPYTKKEIMLIDDGSDNIPPAHLVNLTDKYIRNEQSLGISGSRNIALKEASGQIVFIIDSDIVLKELDIQRVVKFFEKNPDLAALSGAYDSTSKCWNAALDVRRSVIFHKAKKEFKYSLQSLNYTTFSGGMCAIHRGRVMGLKVQENGGLASEDLLFQIELLNLGLEFAYMPSFRGEHLHYRSTKDALKKLISEAKGNDWLIKKSIGQGLKIPVIEGVSAFPLWILLSLILLRPELLVVEFFPYILPVLCRPSLSSIRLLAYHILFLPIKAFYLIRELKKPSYSLIQFMVVSAILAKVRWILVSTLGSRTQIYFPPLPLTMKSPPLIQEDPI